MVERIVECSRQLVDTYEDADGAWSAELASMSGPNEVSQFYAKLKTVRERHRVAPDQVGGHLPLSSSGFIHGPSTSTVTWRR